ncbi:MAG: hypothetical protein OXU20_24490 [Myxococcales bacterium]|nr:hypothetical protein [Myxococcales bacterium]
MPIGLERYSPSSGQPDDSQRLELASVVRPVGATSSAPPVVSVSLRQLRKHMYLQGLSGYGKTELLKLIVMQLVMLGVGFTIVDGVGALVPFVADLMGTLNLRMWADGRQGGCGWKKIKDDARHALLRRFIVVRPGDGWTWHPLKLDDGLTAGEIAGDVIRLLERVFEQDVDSMRRLQTLFRCIITVLAEQGGTTLFDMVHFLCFDTDEVQEYLERLEEKRSAGELPVSPQRLDLVYLNTFFAETTAKERRELASSSMHALNSFLSDRRVAEFLGSPEGNLPSFTDIVQKKMFMAVELPAGGADPRTPKVLGALIVNRLQLVAEARSVDAVKSGEAPLHVLIADEFQNFFSKQWAEAAARVRNKGLALVVSHQTPDQPPFNEDPSLLQAFKDNCSTHVYFRCSYEAAKDAAGPIFQPKGDLLKREYDEVTESVSESWARTEAESISRQVSEAFSSSEALSWSISLGEGRTLSWGYANGISRVETESLSLSWSDSWAQAVSRSEGWTATVARSRAVSQSGGMAEGTSRAEGTGSSEGTSDGSVTALSSGQASSFIMNKGTSHALDPASIALGMHASSGAGHASSSSSGENHANSHSSHQSVSRSLMNGISHVVSSASTLTLGKTKSKGKSGSVSRSDTVGGNRSRGVSRAVAEGLSQVESHGNAQATTITRGLTRQQSSGRTRTQARTTGQTTSRQEGGSKSRSVTRKREFYSVQEQLLIHAQEMANLSSRRVLISISGDEPQAYEARTLDVPQNLMTKLGRRDFTREALEIAAPRPAVPPPSDTPLDRLRAERRHRAMARPRTNETDHG